MLPLILVCYLQDTQCLVIMATSELRDGYELIKDQPHQETMKTSTLWELVECAVKARFHSNIQVLKLPVTQNEFDKFFDEFEISVEYSDPVPREVSRLLVDIKVKEYTNYGEKESDETVVRIENITAKEHGRKYDFSTSHGVKWGATGYTGINSILSLGISGKHSNSTEDKVKDEKSVLSALVFGFNQEERVIIPPGKKAKVKVVTFKVKYQQRLVLRFTISSYYTIAVHYRHRRCCGLFTSLCGSSLCHLNAREILQSLPGFTEEDGKVSFTQEGLLKWVGEDCSVTKTEEVTL